MRQMAIGIYKASTGKYSETELPGSFGGATGTPEQGIDETFNPLRRPQDRELVLQQQAETQLPLPSVAGFPGAVLVAPASVACR